ncbi:hypothetical protein Tco_1424354, partial [Tanacetum coccineum]
MILLDYNYTVLSNSEDSTVTYTAVSSLFGGLSDIRSPGAPPSLDYVPGPEYPPSPDFIPEPVYPEFMLPEDEVLPAEEQPLPAAISPIVDIEEDEEEEHLALADSTAVALPAVEHAPSAEETEPFETDESAAKPPPHPAYRVTANISIRDEPPTPFWSDTKVDRLLAIPTPPPSPLSPWSSLLPHIPSPPLPSILSPLPVSSLPPGSPTYPLEYRAAMIRLRAEAPSTSHSPPPHIILSHTKADTPPSGTPPSGTPPLLPIPLPASSPSLLLPYADHGTGRPEVCLQPRKRLCFAFGPKYEREMCGITDTWDEMLVDMPGAPATDDTELGRRMTEFTTRVRQDTDEIYTWLDDEHKSKAVNECLQLTEVSSDPESSKKSGSKSQTPLPSLKNLQGASPSFEVMTLTYQDHSLRKRSGLGTMKHTKLETQKSSNKNVSRHVTVSNPEPVTSLVPTEVKTNDQESKINELTKLVQMLMDEKINSIQKLEEELLLSPLSPVNPLLEEPIWYLDSGFSRSTIDVKSYLHKYVEQPVAK